MNLEAPTSFRVDAAPASDRLEPEQVESFPLERPRFRRRRNDPSLVPALPHFVVGQENRLAGFVGGGSEEALQLGNPLLIVGPSGTGKTSLALHLAARGAMVRGDERGPGAVSYLPAVEFARRYAEAVETDDLVAFRKEMDQAAVLVLDDLHWIHHKAAAQQELASRLDARLGQGVATIATCRRLPTEVRGLRPILASRLVSGLTVPLQPPQRAARRLLLQEFFLLHGIEIDATLLDRLEQGLELDASVRQLEAVVKQIGLWARMNDHPPTAAAVDSALSAVGTAGRISLAAITNATARHFRLKGSELKSSSRRQRIVRARSLAMWLARRMTTKSLHQIGDHFGGRDHSTVLHAIRKTESLIAQDGDLRRAADEVTEKLAG